MIKPSRLFLKLFLAFWLATSLTFLVGLGILLLGRLFPGDPQMGTVFFNTQKVIEQYGVKAGEPLLKVWASEAHGRKIGLYGVGDQWLAGNIVADDAYQQKVLSYGPPKTQGRGKARAPATACPCWWAPS